MTLLPDDPQVWRKLKLANALGYIPPSPTFPPDRMIAPCLAVDGWEMHCHREAHGPEPGPKNSDLVGMVPMLDAMRNMELFDGR